MVRADGTGRVINPEDAEGVRAGAACRSLPRFAAHGLVLACRRTPLVGLCRGRDRGRLRWC